MLDQLDLHLAPSSEFSVLCSPAHLALYINFRRRTEKIILSAVVQEDEGFMDRELKGGDQGKIQGD